jgi:hypothetical protein
VVGALVLIALTSVGAVYYQRHRAERQRAAKHAADLAAAQAFYRSQPRYLRPFPYTKPPFPVVDLRAETCGRCHQAIYKEWKVSTHARAWTDDAQFMAELHKSQKSGKDVAWMCINCHTPLVNQLEKLVVGLKDGRLDRPIYVDNPTYDKELQKDAITCAVCHVRDGVVLGPYGTTAATAPHRVRKAPELLSSQVCLRCHQARARFPELTLACVFNTGKELAASVYGKQGRTCQSCHMPVVHRSLTNLGTVKRKTRRHWFGGSLIPKKPEFEAELAPLRKVYKDGLALRWVGLPSALAAGQGAVVTAELENAEAGHMLPTGDPERFLRITLSAHAGGKTLAERKLRIGSVYKWYPKIELVKDNRLAPKERRKEQLRFTVPSGATKVTLRLKASKHRISEKNLAYHKLQGKYVGGRVFHRSARVLPIAAAPPR